MKIPETIKINGELFPLLTEADAAKMRLEPITQRLCHIMNEDFLASVIKDFRRAGKPFAIVNVTACYDTHLTVALCAYETAKLKCQPHAIPREKSYKVRSAAKTSKSKAA